MKKTLQVFAPFVLVMGALMFGFSLANSASANGGETCVPQDAQHYSWTGGIRETDNPPTEVPPSDNWQVNTSLEPHTQGGGNPATWVNENLHYTANSDQHASWFYYSPEVVCTPGTEPTTEPTLPTEPTEPTEPTQPTTEPTQPTEPTTPTEPTVPTTTVDTPDEPTLAPPVVSERPPSVNRDAPVPIPTAVAGGI